MTKNENAEGKKVHIRYTAEINYSEDIIKRVTKAQYNTFCFDKKLRQLLIGLIFLLPGLAYSGSPLGIAGIAIGCIIIAVVDWVPKMQANAIIKQYNGVMPSAIYYFSELGIKTNQMSKPVPYDGIIKLVEDKNLLFLFQDENTVFTLERNTVKGSEDVQGFRKYISKETGLEWEKMNSLLRLNAKNIIKEIRG